MDVVLDCGDITNDGSYRALLKGMHMLSTFDAELKLLIPGNHEVSLDEPLLFKRGWYRYRTSKGERLDVRRACQRLRRDIR